jgi:hypothetical protein
VRFAASVINAAAVPRIVSRDLAAVFTLGGGPAADQLLSGGLQSIVSGGRDRDLLVGSTATDTLDGGRAADRIVGGRGKDYVFSADGKRDLVRCGKKRDHLTADRRDKAKGCEEITRTGGHKNGDAFEPSLP